MVSKTGSRGRQTGEISLFLPLVGRFDIVRMSCRIVVVESELRYVMLWLLDMSMVDGAEGGVGSEPASWRCERDNLIGFGADNVHKLGAS